MKVIGVNMEVFLALKNLLNSSHEMQRGGEDLG